MEATVCLSLWPLIQNSWHELLGWVHASLLGRGGTKIGPTERHFLMGVRTLVQQATDPELPSGSLILPGGLDKS